ncbi:maleylpyruvate isomerase N-terminal domain-containing protein [Hymenobacter latericus]|uniref:maleylpyruvate isomerase N-terminal domain-containing protein n=1 Tax=Hymenobacter sp. YIM 151858-1 TaxID=2987688 RepID=UPI002226BAF6|nr:maleylpyruvate isomerase N-terminal domain-containing protein [Hymenobacter sp. YIM 151858-1]UYZ60248.1 maleylpyruvate isomerase N-terminal domain-containing protein [Hymenobacter sp. YIM 151858-1]
MSQPPPIVTLPLFAKLDQRLLAFLRGLSAGEWERQTLAPRWRVMDVALHLLDGNLRTLSMLRDGYFGVQPTGDLGSYRGLVGFLNQLNADWITATRRLSPAIVMQLLEQSGREYSAFLGTLDPWAPATFSVAWAGESESLNWFHVAREYTEKWHHQQQIRQAVGRGESELLQPELFEPYLQTSVRALPHHYRHVAAPEGTVVQVVVETPERTYEWWLSRGATQWTLASEGTAQATTTVYIDGHLAWRLLSKELDAESANKHVRVAGAAWLAAPMLSLTAVMA